jgi:diguanylate cyclase (GGDEF)-like protein
MTALSAVTGRFILDWSLSQKCILTMLLQAAVEMFFLSWKVYVLLNPKMSAWVNVDVMQAQLPISIMALCGCLLLVMLSWLLAGHPRIMRWMPHLCAWLVAFIMSYHAHMIGTLTPLTGIMTIGVGIFGLLLFGRWVTYPPVIAAFILLGISSVLSVSGLVMYGPLFQQPVLPAPKESLFWLGTVTLFGAPLTIGIFLLLDHVIAQWKRNAADIWRLSQTDALTGLYNRHYLSQALKEQANQPSMVSMALLDIDYFKRINDQCGHLVGDRVLQDVAACLHQATRQTDWVGRFGGEEFLIVMPNTSAEDAQQAIERCRINLHAITVHSTQGERWNVSASFGLITLTGPFDVSAGLSEVDSLLYEAKRQGRNRVIYTNKTHVPTQDLSASVG